MRKPIVFSGSKIYGCHKEPVCVPPELIAIQQEWADKANAYGDQWVNADVTEAQRNRRMGGCVLGAGFEFDYQGRSYKMRPTGKWQGSITWESFIGETKERLTEAGATQIQFEFGRMD